jgi:hypothetical protein
MFSQPWSHSLENSDMAGVSRHNSPNLKARSLALLDRSGSCFTVYPAHPMCIAKQKPYSVRAPV